MLYTHMATAGVKGLKTAGSMSTGYQCKHYTFDVIENVSTIDFNLTCWCEKNTINSCKIKITQFRQISRK